MSDKIRPEDLVGAESVVDLDHPLAKLQQAMYQLLLTVGTPTAGMVRTFVNPTLSARVDCYGGDEPILLYTHDEVPYHPTHLAAEIQCYQIALMALGAYWRPELDSAFKDTLRAFSPDYPLPHPMNFGADKGEQVASIYLQLIKRLIGTLDVEMLVPAIPQVSPFSDAHLTDYDRAALAEQQAVLNKFWEQIVADPEAIARYHQSGMAEPWWKPSV